MDKPKWREIYEEYALRVLGALKDKKLEDIIREAEDAATVKGYYSDRKRSVQVYIPSRYAGCLVYRFTYRSLVLFVLDCGTGEPGDGA